MTEGFYFMAKELPYFKFEPNEWNSGMIQLCSLEAKGLFIELCCLYWSRLGHLPYALALQKLCNGNPNLLDQLIQNDIFYIKNDEIIIVFLDEQLNEFKEISRKNSENAKKRWKKNATALPPISERNAIREEEIKEEKKRKENFNLFWDLYDKKVGKPKSEKKWSKLSIKDQQEILDYIPKYKASQPDKKYRKNPETFLNNRSWEDEILSSNGYPDEYDQTYERSLDTSELPKYWKHLKEKGWIKLQTGTGQKVWKKNTNIVKKQ